MPEIVYIFSFLFLILRNSPYLSHFDLGNSKKTLFWNNIPRLLAATKRIIITISALKAVPKHASTMLIYYCLPFPRFFGIPLFILLSTLLDFHLKGYHSHFKNFFNPIISSPLGIPLFGTTIYSTNHLKNTECLANPQNLDFHC